MLADSLLRMILFFWLICPSFPPQLLSTGTAKAMTVSSHTKIGMKKVLESGDGKYNFGINEDISAISKMIWNGGSAVNTDN